MKKLLLSHFSRYPKMQLTDMVKLICQSEFAGGHIISNPEDSLKRIEEECAALKNGVTTAPAFEDIGSGLCRIHLAALSALGLSPAAVNRLFVATARNVQGSMEGFSQKLRILRQSCEDGALPYTPAGVDVFITKAKSAKSSPLLRHSDTYRAAYAPAYRVIKTAYADFAAAFARIDALLEIGKPVTLAIDGHSGSGKSTLAALLTEAYDCNVFHMDDFFLPPVRKTPERLGEPGGNVDYERFANEVMTGLKSGGAFSYRPYNCQTGDYKNSVTILPKALNIVEGVYSLHPLLADVYDLKLFLKTDAETQAARIRQRSGEAMFQRFISEWIPLENVYFDKLKIEQSCDLVFGT